MCCPCCLTKIRLFKDCKLDKALVTNYWVIMLSNVKSAIKMLIEFIVCAMAYAKFALRKKLQFHCLKKWCQKKCGNILCFKLNKKAFQKSAKGAF